MISPRRISIHPLVVFINIEEERNEQMKEVKRKKGPEPKLDQTVSRNVLL